MVLDFTEFFKICHVTKKRCKEKVKFVFTNDWMAKLVKACDC
jgi:hypothetical protein